MGLLDQAHSFAQGASNGVAGSLTGPVDGLAWLLRKAGVPVPQAPLGGSDWMRSVGLMQEPQERMAGLLGEGVGSALPAVIAGKAPEIAGGLLKMGDNAMAPRTLNPQTGAIVWHGSPHKFEKFDSSKIGTGEGAQAYGHGLYLAENPKVADEYAGKLSKSIVEFKNAAPANEYEKALQAQYQSLADRTQLGSKWETIYNQWVKHANPVSDFLYGNSYAGVKPMSPEQLKTALAYRDAAKRLGEPVLSDTGSLYKVDLPDEHIAKMLDWDKPLSQQSKEVQAAFQSPEVQSMVQSLKQKGVMGDYSADDLAKFKGEDWHDFIRQASSDSNVAPSEFLKQRGIPGIRYLDGGSRAGGAGTSNYVVFPGNEGLLKILERNGQGLLGN